MDSLQAWEEGNLDEKVLPKVDSRLLHLDLRSLIAHQRHVSVILGFT